MDLWGEIKTCRTKAATAALAQKICSNPGPMVNGLMEIYLGGEDGKASRAAWVVKHCYDRCPEVIQPYVPDIIQRLGKPAPKGVKRTGTYILQFTDPDEDTAGLIAGLCFNFLNDRRESVAVRSFSMGALYRVTRFYPGLREELRQTIEMLFPYGSPGFKSRGRKILKKLNNS